MKNKYICLIFFLCTGCSFYRLFIPYNLIDVGVTESGETYIKDSKRNFFDFTNAVELAFQREIGGAVFKNMYTNVSLNSREEAWGYSIYQIKTGKPDLYENPTRRIEYINKRRKELNLPPAVEWIP